MTTTPPDTSFATLLESALTEPGVISAAYTAFHGYSIGNQIHAYLQCAAREIPIGPIATFKGWQTHGRYVRKGEKAIELCMPITCKRRETQPATDGTTGDDPSVFTRFVFRRNWFVLSQTDGQAFEPVAIPDWNEDHALTSLDITRVPFETTDGNCQGYARGRAIAVSPVAEYPHKTTFHEIAHVVLGHTAESNDPLTDSDRTPRTLREVEAEAVAYIVCAALTLPGAEESRGYIQYWNTARGADPVPETSARKIFKAANTILAAGKPAVENRDRE